MAFPILGTPAPQFLDASGDPYASGTLAILDPTDDSNLDSYPSANDADAGTNANVNPVVLNSRGSAPALWGKEDTNYKIVLKDSLGATIDTHTNIRTPARDAIYADTAETQTDAGAVDPDNPVTWIVTTTNSALTLANAAVEGQRKFILMKTEAGVATLTPTNLANGTSLVFDDIGDSADLIFSTGQWHYLGGTATVIGGRAIYDQNHLGLIDPTSWAVYWNDFMSYTAADWVVTTTEDGGGSASEVVNAAGSWGTLKLTNDNFDNDLDFLQLSNSAATVQETFSLATTRRMVFKTRIRLSDADLMTFFIGLIVTDTTPFTDGGVIAHVDGIGFRVADTGADGEVDFFVTKDSSSTVTSGITTLSDSTYVELMWVIDEAGILSYYVDGTLGGTSATTNLPNDENLAISFGIMNGSAAAHWAEIDYIYCAVEASTR